jgi:hypothetical protein
MWDAPISALLNSPTVSGRFLRLYSAQNYIPIDAVKKNPLQRLFSSQVGEEKWGFTSPIIGGG